MTREFNLLEASLEKTLERSQVTRESEIKRIIEALLFSCSEAISLQKLREIISTAYPVSSSELKKMISEMKRDYEDRGHAFQIDEIAEGFLFRTVESMRTFVELLHQDRRGEKLSRAAMEILAIIAYRQPITRREIESLRGVDSSGALMSLVERGLVDTAGRRDTPGKPMQYEVTKKFLQHFGLKNLNDLMNADLK